ncbi:hypothetical protein B2D07_10185 [Desulfococcus multivorans]|nr:hypothetical protein B2D07_10185 [Desulfococcus multivorans]
MFFIMRLPDKKLIRPASAALLVFILSACMVGPEHLNPGVAPPGTFKYAASPHQTLAAPLSGKWWERFEDATLNRLVEAAMTDNYELAASAHRITQARAIARASRSDLFPALSADPGYARRGVSETIETNQGGTFTTWTAPLNVAYEFDLFGRIRSGYAASLADAEAVVEDDNGLRLILQSEIAVTYFAMRAFDDDIRIVSRTIEVRRESLTILKNRHMLGVISRLPVARAEAELRATEALLLSLQRDRTLLENAVATLLGKTPVELSLAPAPLDNPPPDMPSVLPSVLLIARPDIRRAERIMAAENARVGVAAAALYPQVTLGANIGYSSTRASDLFDARSFAWGILPNIHIPLFEGGRNIAELERARARYAEMYAAYRQTIVQAFGEVEDALVSVSLLERQQRANEQAVQSADEAYRLSMEQFEGGLVDYLSVLDAERTLLDNLLLKTRLRGQRYLSAVALVKAIGGSWETEPGRSLSRY